MNKRLLIFSFVGTILISYCAGLLTYMYAVPAPQPKEVIKNVVIGREADSEPIFSSSVLTYDEKKSLVRGLATFKDTFFNRRVGDVELSFNPPAFYGSLSFTDYSTFPRKTVILDSVNMAADSSVYPVTTTNPAILAATVYYYGGEIYSQYNYFVNSKTQDVVALMSQGNDAFSISVNQDIIRKVELVVHSPVRAPEDTSKVLITYKGIRVNGVMRYTVKNPTAFEIDEVGVGPISWGKGEELLGFDKDLKKFYFFDGYKYFSYDFMNDKLVEVEKVPELLSSI